MSEEGPTKKLIRAPSDLVSKINEAARNEGKTLYDYISEILEQAIRAKEIKHSLKEVLDNFEIFEVHRKAGTTFIPSDILDWLVVKIFREDGESLQLLWHQTGRWYGIYLKEKFEDPLNAFIRLIKDGRWDLNEVGIIQNNGILEFRCVSPFISQERTLLIQNFIEGTMRSLDFKTLEKDCFKGIIRLKFSK